MHFARRREALGGLKLHGDFSLNITNSVSAREVIAAGLDSFTVAHDLDAVQLEGLLRESSSAHAAVTIHHHDRSSTRNSLSPKSRRTTAM